MRRVELSDMDHGQIEFLMRCEQQKHQGIVDNPLTTTPTRRAARAQVSHWAELRRKFMAAETF